MKALAGRSPSGRLTFLIAAAEGASPSPRLLNAGNESEVRHHRVLRRATARYRGSVTGHGETLFGVFVKAEDAIHAAIAAHEELCNESSDEVRVRFGVYTSTESISTEKQVRKALGSASQMLERVRGGEVIVSGATAKLIDGRLRNLQLIDIGVDHQEQDHHVFQLAGGSLPGSPATLGAASVLHNLLPPASSFVGRTLELDEICGLVKKHRLVTITGLGGIGKTRLALEVARAVSIGFSDGCWLIRLRDVANAGEVADVIAQTLGFRPVAGEHHQEALLEYLLDKKLLLLIDNAEHLLPLIAADVRRLLDTTSDVQMLITSREPLHVPGEYVFRLGPLREGVALFRDRLQASIPNADSADSAAIERVCQKLEGIPLAIELVAARAGTVPLSELDVLFEALLRSLTQSGAESPIITMLEWSLWLLTREERQLFLRMAIFEGSLSVDAAHAVAEVADRETTVQLLASLSDKSLVSSAVGEGAAQFSMLSVVRDFAVARLERTSDYADVRRRFCVYYARVAQNLSVAGANSEAAITLVASQWQHVRLALRYLLEDGDDVQLGRWMVRSLWDFWMATGRTSEGWWWVNAALQGADMPAGLRAEFLQRAARLAASRRDFSALEPLARLQVEMYERSSDRSALGMALQLRATARLGLGDGEGAEADQRRALAEFRDAGDRRGVALALGNLGTIAEQVHLNYETSRQLLLHSLELFKELGIPLSCAETMGNLAVTNMRAGDFTQALLLAQESRAIFERLGNSEGVGLQCINAAEIEIECGKSADAARHLKAARQALGEHAPRLLLCYYYEAAVKLAVTNSRYDDAARLYGFAERQRRIAGVPLQHSEQVALDLRYNAISRALSRLELSALTRDGARMDATAVEGLIDRLASAPNPPSAVC